MHDTVTAHLVRRGIKALRQDRTEEQRIQEGVQRLRSPMSIAVLCGTALAYLFFAVAVEYVIRFVVGNLAIVENTSANSAEPSQEFERDGLLNSSDADDEKLNTTGNGNGKIIPADADEEKMGSPVTGTIITKGIRSTTRHLRSIGGFRSLFRGFGPFTLYIICFVVLSLALEDALAFIPKRYGREGITNLLCILAVSPLRCSWTHATLRAPSSGKPRAQTKSGSSGLRRNAGWRAYIPGVWSKHLILPVIRLSIAIALSVYVSFAAIPIAGAASGHMDNAVVTVLAFLPIVLGILAGFVLVIPTIMALIRVEASLLPESDEAVVPFDRTFGGRIDYSKEQSRWNYVFRNLSIIGAWKTINKEVYIRVTKIFIKFFFIYLFVHLLFAFLFVFELYAILGDAFGAFMASLLYTLDMVTRS